MLQESPPGLLSVEELKKFHAVVEQAFSMVLITDAYGRIEYVNPRFCEVTGYSRDEVGGRFIHELGPLSCEIERDMWETVSTGRAWRGEFEAPKKNGDRYWVYSTIAPMRDDAGQVTNYLGINLDITDNKRGQTALMELDIKLGLMLGQMPSILWTTDGELRVTSFVGGGLTQFDVAFGDVNGRTLRELFDGDPTGDDPIAAHLRALTGESAAYEQVIQDRHFSARVEPFRDGDGRVVGCIGVAADVTEYRKTEQALEESRERNRAILDNYPDGVCVVVDGKMEYTNPAFAKLTGYALEDTLGMSNADFVVPEQREIAQRRTKEVIAGAELAAREYELVREDRTTVAVEVESRPFSYGGRPGMLSIIRDMRARKEAENALRRSEEMYRTLYQDNPTMYFTVDASGTVLSVNLFGAHQLGYQPEELIGRSVSEVFVPDDRKSVAKQLKATLRKPGAIVEWEFRKIKKTGEVIWVKETARATLDHDGRPIVLIVCEDITEHRRLAEELQRVREDLERRVEKQLETRNPYGLTFRQLTILHLIADGESDKEIATVLGISTLTVNKHVSRVLRRMGASSRTQAGVRAFRERLIT